VNAYFDFTTVDKDGKATTVNGRESSVYVKATGKWFGQTPMIRPPVGKGSERSQHERPPPSLPRCLRRPRDVSSQTRSLEP
jgi:hypothetical protein